MTSGPTREPIDPVRYIANHSSGKQGHAIAAALAQLGAEVTLVSGPVSVPDPAGVHGRGGRVGRRDAGRLPRRRRRCRGLRRRRRRLAGGQARHGEDQEEAGAAPPALELTENPDILATLSKRGPNRPALVVGFAAETENVVANAIEKRRRKGCDWILANDVSPATGTFGGDRNTVHLVTAEGVEAWPTLTKDKVAMRLAGASRCISPAAAGRGRRVSAEDRRRRDRPPAARHDLPLPAYATEAAPAWTCWPRSPARSSWSRWSG